MSLVTTAQSWPGLSTAPFHIDDDASNGSTLHLLVDQALTRGASARLIVEALPDGELCIDTDSDALSEVYLSVVTQASEERSLPRMLGVIATACASVLEAQSSPARDPTQSLNVDEPDGMFGDPLPVVSLAAKPTDGATRKKPTNAQQQVASLVAKQQRAQSNLPRGSAAATQRLIRDLEGVIEPKATRPFGFECDVDEENLYKWTALLHFDEGNLAKDLKKLKKPGVELEILFPNEYPFDAPFVRVVRPRFQFHTGHVTVGGSICMELLTRSGWSPSNDIESIIVQIRAEMLQGGARLEPASKQRDYSMEEARSAFERVAAQHGWS